MRAAGADELRVVTRPEKVDVVEYTRTNRLTLVQGHPATAAASIALGAAGLGDDDVVLIGFPDTVWDPVDGYARLLPHLADADVVLGVFRSRDDEQLRRSDVVALDERGRVTRIEVKAEQPSSRLIWGLAAARRRSLEGLEGHVQPGQHFDELVRRGGEVVALELPGTFVDVGTPESLEAAQS
jgi:NDP-sugar pyrophosphorylase family protein